MNLPSDDKRFLDLLQKWQEGDFTRRDELELQSLAGSDDFRREAWEGFQLHPEADHEGRLAALRARIRPERGGRRVLFPQIMAAAAVFVVLLGALWFFRGPGPQIPEKIVQNDAPVIDNPSLSDAAEPAAQPDAPQVLKDVAAGTVPEKPASPRVAADDRMAGAGAGPEKKSESETVVMNDLATPAPPSVASTPVQAESAEKDDEVVAMEESSSRKEQQGFAEDKKESKAKAAPARKPQFNEARQSAPGNANAMEPADYDMIALQDYLRRNARLPEAARQNNVSGFVRVSFRLNNKREPKDFKILHSLEYGCDEEALRLLRAYDWRNFTRDTFEVEVPFVR